jgi:hypothetical protein
MKPTVLLKSAISYHAALLTACGPLIITVLAILALTGCSTKYEPQLTLPPQSFDQSIDAAVELHPLLASEAIRTGHANFGVVAEDYVNKPPSKMSKAITAEILNEFSANGVFRQISLYDPHPDYVLTGRVDRFFEHDRRKLWTYVPYYSDKLANLFRLNTYMSSGEVEVTMMLLKPSGELVGTYVGHSKFEEDFTPNDEIKPGGRLNRAFSEALTQIRDEMLADTNLPKTRKVQPMVQVEGRKE